MRLIILAVLLTFGSFSQSFAAFSTDVIVLETKEIVKLSDEQLIDAYMNVIVEIDANKTFHATSGFTPKDYNAFKNMLKFRLLLLMEIHKRALEIPQFDRFSV